MSLLSILTNCIFIYIILFVCLGPPRFVVETPNQQAVNGTEVTIQCYAVAEPLHRVTWFFTNASNVTVEIGSSNTSVADGYAINSVTVIGSNGEPQAAVPAEYGSLTILNIQYGDRGVYRCRPENRYAAIETSTAVNVQGMVVGQCIRPIQCKCVLLLLLLLLLL